jgi:hypothetical protein
MPCCVKTGLATGPCRNLEEPKLTLVDDIKRVVRTIYILFSSSEIPIAKEDQEILDLADLSTPLPECGSLRRILLSTLHSTRILDSGIH